jgi:hypothetical protein
MRISFCTACMNRCYQLKETLPRNLELIAEWPDVEIVVLNYNSSDGMHDWMTSNYGHNPSRFPQLTYARQRSALRFHAPRAKNLAHKIASGDVLVNLDADNFIGRSVEILRERFLSSEADVVHLWSGIWGDGTYGRIALRRTAFYELGGYDEAFFPVGHQDCDLLMRASARGLRTVHAPAGPPGALPNTKADTTKHCRIGISYDQMQMANYQMSQENLKRGRLRANPYGWGQSECDILMGSYSESTASLMHPSIGQTPPPLFTSSPSS